MALHNFCRGKVNRTAILCSHTQTVKLQNRPEQSLGLADSQHQALSNVGQQFLLVNFRLQLVVIEIQAGGLQIVKMQLELHCCKWGCLTLHLKSPQKPLRCEQLLQPVRRVLEKMTKIAGFFHICLKSTLTDMGKDHAYRPPISLMLTHSHAAPICKTRARLHIQQSAPIETE